MRLAIILSHPTQYYSPWFRWIASHCDLTVRVIYLWDSGIRAERDLNFGETFKWDVDLLSGNEHEFVPNTARHPSSASFRGLHNPTLLLRLKSWAPTAILMFGYRSESHLKTVQRARTHRKPQKNRGDTQKQGRGAPSAFQAIALRLLYAQFAAF